MERLVEQEAQSTLKSVYSVNNKVSFNNIRKTQYDTIAKSINAKNQEIALIEAQIIDSLATKFYCPEFAKWAVI